MIDKYDLRFAIQDFMPELKTLDRSDVLELIMNMKEAERPKIQVWAVTDNTVPLSLGLFEDITEFRIPIKLFKDNVIIEFEDDTTNSNNL